MEMGKLNIDNPDRISDFCGLGNARTWQRFGAASGITGVGQFEQHLIHRMRVQHLGRIVRHGAAGEHTEPFDIGVLEVGIGRPIIIHDSRSQTPAVG